MITARDAFLPVAVTAIAIAFGFAAGRLSKPVVAPVCPEPVVWNPLWSENPHGIGGRVGDSRRLSPADRLAVLEAQLSDPYRSPVFDSELKREIARLKKQLTKQGAAK